MHHHPPHTGRLMVVCVAITVLLLALASRINAQAAIVIHVDAVAGDNAGDGSIRPVKTVARGVELAKAINARNQAVVVQIAPGVYRESLNWRSTTDAAVTITAAQPHTAVISGADVWTGWRAAGDLLVHDWVDNWGLSPIPSNWLNNGLNVPITDIVRRRELVIVDGVRLTQVLNAGALATDNTYYVDETANTLTINPPANPQVIEVGRRQRLADIQNANNVTIRGLVFEGSVISFDQDAAYLNSLDNVLLDNNVFRRNNGGGLFLGRSNGATRGNLFDDNGTVGFAGAYNHDYTSTDDTATGNNWRGDLGNFLTWHPAGVKHLHSRNVTYIRLRTNGNRATGFWLDTDHESTVVQSLEARGNKLHGLYIEASQGAVAVNNAVIDGNAQYGVYLSSVNAVTMTNNRVSANGYVGVFIGGTNPTRSVWNHVTRQQMDIYPARNITWSGNQFGGLRQSAPAMRYGTGQFNEQFRPTYKGGNNYWWNADGSSPIQVGSTFYTVSQWQALTGQDVGSVQGAPQATAAPIPRTPTPTTTPSPEATRTPEFATMTPTWEPTPVTPEMTPSVMPVRYIIRIDAEIRFEVITP